MSVGRRKKEEAIKSIVSAINNVLTVLAVAIIFTLIFLETMSGAGTLSAPQRYNLNAVQLIMSASILRLWAGRVYEIVGLSHRLLVKPAPTRSQIIQGRMNRT